MKKKKKKRWIKYIDNLKSDNGFQDVKDTRLWCYVDLCGLEGNFNEDFNGDFNEDYKEDFKEDFNEDFKEGNENES